MFCTVRIYKYKHGYGYIKTCFTFEAPAYSVTLYEILFAIVAFPEIVVYNVAEIDWFFIQYCMRQFHRLTHSAILLLLTILCAMLHESVPGSLR